MPLLLYRYIIADLFRVLGLTVGILVTVIAFGATIKPLAEDELLSASQTAKYVFLVMVPMLQFALPFAAGFASTLVLHRMTADNEILAAAVSGISYRKLVAPIVALGLVLLLIMMLLVHWVVPLFWGLMQRTIATDVVSIFQSAIEHHVPFQKGKMQIYADEIFSQPHPADSQADMRLILLGVAAAKLDDGRITGDVTANYAYVDVYRRPEGTYLALSLKDTVAYDGQRLVRSQQAAPTKPLLIPNAFVDEPMTKTRGELLHLREFPDDFTEIREDRDDLAQLLEETTALTQIDQQLRASGQVELIETLPQAPGAAAPKIRRYVIHADQIDDRTLEAGNKKPVWIDQYEGNTLLRRISSTQAELQQSDRSTFGERKNEQPTFELVLGDFEVTDAQSGGAPNLRSGLTLKDLSLASGAVQDFSDLTAAQLVAKIQATQNLPHRIEHQAQKLGEDLVAFRRGIDSRIMRRTALAATAPLLLLLGACLAMWLKHSVPLVIYLWAFLPAILNVILISGGAELLNGGNQLGGLAVMWGGHALLLLITLVAYINLSRH